MSLHRSFSCAVPVTIILSEDFLGRSLPLTRTALKALAHAMVYDALRFTEAERGFFAEGAGEACDEMSVSWVMPKGYDDLDNLVCRIAKGRRLCANTHSVIRSARRWSWRGA